jgi:ribonucleoside-triphosphate reductase (thioredoxin)
MNITKRDGSIVPFNPQKIHYAVSKCLKAINTPDKLVDPISKKVTLQANKLINNSPTTVEHVQDCVERALMMSGQYEACKSYILYREYKRQIRSEVPYEVSQEDMSAIRSSARRLPHVTQLLTHMDKYSRWDDKKHRRETYDESVMRTINYFRNRPQLSVVDEDTWNSLTESMLNMEAMPSMRTFQMSGPPLERCEVGSYNCAFTPITCLDDLVDILYISMQGTGIAFSVEKQFVENMPPAPSTLLPTINSFVVQDSTEGWCDALRYVLSYLFSGNDVRLDYRKIRKEGARLKTKGGTASGYAPLAKLVDFIRDKVKAAAGRQLTPLEWYDISTMIGEIVHVGGVRRSAMLSLSDLEDEEMRDAKAGSFWEDPNKIQRRMANNSVAYKEKPDWSTFLGEWESIRKSGTGERGIFNREGSIKQMPERRRQRIQDYDPSMFDRYGTNPCAEILLLAFCNLSISVARSTDTEDSLTKKVRNAAIFGTFQSSLTDFKYIQPRWKEYADLERLLGVDIIGQMDCPLLQPTNPDRANLLERLRQVVIDTNKEWAEKIGIEQSTATTCVKPSGNSSSLLGTSFSTKARYAPYYIRRMRFSAHNPLAKFMKDEGVPCNPEYGSTWEDASIWVFEFPMKAPEGAKVGRDYSAIDQFENWLVLKQHWAEHSVSVTIDVGDNEWDELGKKIYENWDHVSGLSFLPRDNNIYPLMPYEEITKKEYEKLESEFPDLDWSKLIRYDRASAVTSSTELACLSGNCET